MKRPGYWYDRGFEPASDVPTDFAAVDNIRAAYLQAASTERRLFNQASFETIAIDTEEIDGHELAPPFAQLATLNHHYEEHSANGRPGRGTKKRTPNPAKVRGSDAQLFVGRTEHCASRDVVVTGSPLALT